MLPTLTLLEDKTVLVWREVATLRRTQAMNTLAVDVVVVVVMLWRDLVWQVTTADVRAGHLRLISRIKLGLTVHWLSKIIIIIIIGVLLSNLAHSIETVAVEDSVPLEASDGQDHFLAAGKRSVVIATSAIICEKFSARGDGAEAGHDVTCHEFVTRCHASVTLWLRNCVTLLNICVSPEYFTLSNIFHWINVTSVNIMTLSLPGRCDLAERQIATERYCVQLIAGCFPSPGPGSRTIWASSDVTLSSFSEPVNELTKTSFKVYSFIKTRAHWNLFIVECWKSCKNVRWWSSSLARLCVRGSSV